jgi:hypothetical protein
LREQVLIPLWRSMLHLFIRDPLVVVFNGAVEKSLAKHQTGTGRASKHKLVEKYVKPEGDVVGILLFLHFVIPRTGSVLWKPPP